MSRKKRQRRQANRLVASAPVAVAGEVLSRAWVQVLLLVAGAAVPCVGVLAGSWSLREVVVLYWAENVVIGLFQMVKMITVSPEGMPAAGHLGKLFTVPFFTVHYGGFCFVHGIFVFALTGGAFGGSGGPGGGNAPPDRILAQVGEFPAPFWLALGLIALHHFQQLVQRFFLQGEWRRKGIQDLMGEPYKHIIVVHLGIILGAFLSIALHNSIGVLLIIVIGKFLIDLGEILTRGRNAQADSSANG